MRLDNIKLGNIDFEWGLTINELKNHLQREDYFENENKYSNLKTLRVKISDQWGIKLNSCVFSSPNYSRLINRIRINLGKIDKNIDKFLRKLDDQFGERIFDTINDYYGSNSVIRNCKWIFANCDVGVSIFGGKRLENCETNYGVLYFHLTDLELIDRLYSFEWRNRNKTLEDKILRQKLDCEVFTLKRDQTEYWYNEMTKFSNYSKDFVSTVFSSFYEKNLLITPTKLKRSLMQNQICIFKESTDNQYYIANQKEACLLEENCNVIWHNSLPAKGPGYSFITIDDFRINDNHSQPEMKRIIEKLESILKIKAKYYEVYDC